MNLNDNARYAVLTKGFNETEDIIESLEGGEKLSSDYCGFGDLVLTATSRVRSNYMLFFFWECFYSVRRLLLMKKYLELYLKVKIR